MRKRIFILTTAVTLLMTSCATLFTGTKDTIRFDSNPQGAKVYIDGLQVCKTPCTTQVKRSLSDKLAEIKLDGYETRVITLSREFNVVSVINLTNLVGWAIDAATGALMIYDKKGYNIELEKGGSISPDSTAKIEISTKEKSIDLYVFD